MNNELIETLILARMKAWGDISSVGGVPRYSYTNSKRFTDSNYKIVVGRLSYLDTDMNDLKRVAIDNRNFNTPADGLWYRLTVQHGVNLMVGMADTPCTRELGAVVVQIFYPNNQVTRPAKQVADSLGSHFQYYRTGKLEFMTASIINVPQREDGYQLNVRIPFRYN